METIQLAAEAMDCESAFLAILLNRHEHDWMLNVFDCVHLLDAPRLIDYCKHSEFKKKKQLYTSFDLFIIIINDLNKIAEKNQPIGMHFDEYNNKMHCTQMKR